MQSAILPDGRAVFCVNAYEVDFGAQEIFSGDLSAHGLCLPPDGTYLDVGANIGLFSIYLRDRCPASRIIAFEPMPAVFESLTANLATLNPPGLAVRLALGERPGWSEFYYCPGITAISTKNRALGQSMVDGVRVMLGGQPADAELQDDRDGTSRVVAEATAELLEDPLRLQCVRVEVDTLSAQISALGVRTVDLLKIDTEGAEREVLAGLSEADWPRIRQLLVEAHLGREEAEAMAAELRGHGYTTSICGHPLSQGGVEVFHIYARR
jgi:FkbM family methyltransferase